MAVSPFSSTFTLPILNVPRFSLASSSIVGPIIRQGPHQGAQKSTRTGTSESSTCCWKFSSVNSRACPAIAKDSFISAGAGVMMSWRPPFGRDIAFPSIPVPNLGQSLGRFPTQPRPSDFASGGVGAAVGRLVRLGAVVRSSRRSPGRGADRAGDRRPATGAGVGDAQRPTARLDGRFSRRARDGLRASRRHGGTCPQE